MRIFAVALCLALLPASANAQRSWRELPSSNGYTGVVVDLSRSRVHHFRDHLFATEEPRWNGDGTEVWVDEGGGCFKPQAVYSRDLLWDAYFGLDARGVHGWLAERPVNEDASGYDPESGRDGRDGGTGIVRMVQDLRDAGLRATTRVHAPWGLERPAFVMLLEVTNTEPTGTGPMKLYGLVNARLGSGRPGPDRETGADFETVTRFADLVLGEQGFAGAIAVVPIGAASRATHSPEAFYATVRDGGGDLPEPASTGVLGDDQALAHQWDIADLASGESAWVGVLVAYDANPDALDALADEARTWVAAREAQAVWTAERDEWAAFQARLSPPAGLTLGEVDLYRHSAAILRMAQVRESQTWLRSETDPGTPRHTGTDLAVVTPRPPGETRVHAGSGALLASLPPGRWTYAWVRDGAYGIVGLADAGLHDEARAALAFYLDASADRYREYGELDGVSLLPYALSLTRYHGFGLEESDTLCGGDFNFEWDGFGLYLWALRRYVEASGDDAFLTARWPTVRDEVAAVAEGLIETDTGLLAADSSIWEVHWLGKEKHFAYTSITAARGLCDAGALARRLGDEVSAERFETAGRRVRRAIHQRLRDSSGAIAANTEELAAGLGYHDAAVLDAIAMGLFDPTGPTAQATLASVRTHLTVASGTGLARNDDENDAHDLTPYGSSYDSVEWVFIDYRAAVAAGRMGDAAFSEALRTRIRDRSLANYLLIAENYDPSTGDYVNNAPMIGFGAGSELTLAHLRTAGFPADPACGEYFEAETSPGTDGGAPDASGPDGGAPDAGTGGDGGLSDGGSGTDGGSTEAEAGCGCGSDARGASASGLLLLLASLAARRRRRAGRG